MNKMNLPIDNYKDAIVEAIAKNDFLIVVGNTGCGKTTRMPQFLVERFSQVIVTEPRILTVKNASHRVAEEMGLTVGKEIGYKTGYDKCYSKDSKILFCTDGLQLVRTITMADGRKENVLVIDEIHLWNINMESLVAWCKFMRNKWNTKVVIMSATMDPKLLQAYLGRKTEIIEVPGRLFDVAVEHRRACDLIPTILEFVAEKRETMVFTSGKKEMEKLMYDVKKTGCNAVILPLHGELEWEEQKRCYLEYDVPKVIVATNIAQDGVTIPRLNIVDTGKAKINNAESGVEGLVEIEISKADCKQREGRAARTEDGRYVLCSDYPYEKRDDYNVPEIQRSILDRIVLQLAAAGLDAEKLEFFHQPDTDAIRLAKKKLIAFGATDKDNNVTKLGAKMVKMPISVEYARMIIEAEKYGVTEQVMTIAATVEMGGLLKRGKDADVTYRDFTAENKSDLLAELDVWNRLSEMKNINFKEVGVTKKRYNQIKTHIQKLRNAISDQVEIKRNNDRRAILKSCLSGLSTNLFFDNGYDEFFGDDGVGRRIDNSSCISHGYYNRVKCVAGTPKSFPCKNRWGETYQMNLVTFATVVERDMIEELVPDKIRVETDCYYSASEDAVEVYTTKYYRDWEIGSDYKIDYNHPEYETLKADYEEEQRRIEERRARILSNSNNNHDYSYSYAEVRKPTVTIDGKEFCVSYNYYSKPYIYVDDKTLFTTEVKNVQLDDGTKVILKSENVYRRETESMVELRNIVENQRVNEIRDTKKNAYMRIQVDTLQDALKHADKIGAIELTMNNGGYGDEAIVAYGCITLKKKTVSFELLEDEEKAAENTREALQYLFMKMVEKNYPIRCFSAQKGKKKKVLTPKENEVKMQFDSLVRELLADLTVDNATETLEFLDEYFLELTEGIRKAS